MEPAESPIRARTQVYLRVVVVAVVGTLLLTCSPKLFANHCRSLLITAEGLAPTLENCVLLAPHPKRIKNNILAPNRLAM